MKLLWLILFVLLPALMVSAGSFELHRNGENYSLTADQALLSDILKEIDRQEPADLRFYGNYETPVSAKYQSLSLDQLLYRLGVSYVLTYEQADDGTYQLGDAVMLDSDAYGVNREVGSDIRELVRNLRDDDVSGNALDAYYKLSELGCDAVPFLEEELLDTDFQGRQSAASLLRQICPEHRASDRLIDVTFELLNIGELDYNQAYLIMPYNAYDFLNGSNIYPRVHNRLANNLQSKDPREQLYSALMIAEHGETAYAGQLCRIMLPHLADNDLENDAAICTYAIFQLGKIALPHIQAFRHSKDPQQAELVDLICTTLEENSEPTFNPVMYASYAKVPVTERGYINILEWNRENFPDAQGNYDHLEEPRMTAADYYGTSDKYVTSEETYMYKGEESEVDETISEQPFPYIVKSGDTLSSICIRFSVPEEKMLNVNPHVINNPIRVGMVMMIPWD